MKERAVTPSDWVSPTRRRSGVVRSDPPLPEGWEGARGSQRALAGFTETPSVVQKFSFTPDPAYQCGDYTCQRARQDKTTNLLRSSRRPRYSPLYNVLKRCQRRPRYRPSLVMRSATLVPVLGRKKKAVVVVWCK